MSGFFQIDFGPLLPGAVRLNATGSSASKPILLNRKVSIFSVVPSGATVMLPSNGAAETQLFVLNRGVNSLSVAPPPADQIEFWGVGVPIPVAPGANAALVSFDPPAQPPPRTWWGVVSAGTGFLVDDQGRVVMDDQGQPIANT